MVFNKGFYELVKVYVAFYCKLSWNHNSLNSINQFCSISLKCFIAIFYLQNRRLDYLEWHVGLVPVDYRIDVFFQESPSSNSTLHGAVIARYIVNLSCISVGLFRWVVLSLSNCLKVNFKKLVSKEEKFLSWSNLIKSSYEVFTF